MGSISSQGEGAVRKGEKLWESLQTKVPEGILASGIDGGTHVGLYDGLNSPI